MILKKGKMMLKDVEMTPKTLSIAPNNPGGQKTLYELWR